MDAHVMDSVRWMTETIIVIALTAGLDQTALFPSKLFATMALITMKVKSGNLRLNLFIKLI